MKLRFDEERARVVFATLQDLWERKVGVFEGFVLPQDRFQLPDDPVEKANTLLFMAITQRGGIVSEDPVKYLAALRQVHPDLFDPRGVVENWTAQRIQDVLQQFVIERGWKRDEKRANGKQLGLFQDIAETVQNGQGLYKVNEFAASWRRNAVTLAERWQGNVLNMFVGIADFEGFFARADYKRNTLGIHGMRRKILALFTIWLQEKKLIPMFPTPLPVDFHALRLLFATGVVVAEDVELFQVREGAHPRHFQGRALVRVTEKLMDEIALWSQNFMVQNGFSHLCINPALWVLSRELCPHELQNQSVGRRSRIQLAYADDLERYPEFWPVPYDDPAIHCPLAGFCTKVVPWVPYYDFGILALDKRVSYPHQRLPGWIKPNGHAGRKRKERQ